MNCLPKLNELVTASHNLKNGKITERKKAIDKVSSLIKDQDVIAFLNSSKSSKNVNWTSLFESAVENLVTDAQNYVEAKQSSKATTVNSKQQKVNQSCGFLKTIIQTANKGQPLIKLHRILPTVIRILDVSDFVNCIGNAFINILKNDIVCRRKYACQMITTDYQQVVAILMELFDQQTVDRSLLTKCLLTVIKAITHHCDQRNFTNLFELLSEKSNLLQSENNSALVEVFIDCINTYAWWLSSSHRYETIIFLENIFENMLALWKNKHLSKNMLQFFKLQIKIHHPNMATKSEWNCMVSNRETWLGKLKQLLLVLEKYLADSASKSNLKFAKDSQNNNADFYETIAYILHVICQLSSSKDNSSYSVSPLNSMFSTQKSTNTFSAIESYSTLVEVICDLDESRLTHLLNVICIMQQSCPCQITESTLRDLCKNVLKILAETFNRSIQSLCIKILLCSVSDLEKSKDLQNGINWKQMWRIAKRLLHQNPTSDEADMILNLMTKMIKCDNMHHRKLLQSDIIQDILPLIYNNVLASNAAMNFVGIYIASYDICTSSKDKIKICKNLFESDQQRVYNQQYKSCTDFENCVQKFQFKILLIDWILKFKEENIVSNLNLNSTFMQRGEKGIVNTTALYEFNLFLSCDYSEENVLNFLGTLFSKKMQYAPISNLHKEMNLFTDCFDLNFVSAWQCFQHELLENTQPSLPSHHETSLISSLAMVFCNALKYNMEILYNSVNNYDNFIHWATNNLLNYLRFFKISQNIFSKVKPFLQTDDVNMWQTDLNTKNANVFVLQFLESISAQLWTSNDMISCTNSILFIFEKLISYNKTVEKESQCCYNEFVPVLKNILLSSITSNTSTLFRRYSYETEKSSENSSHFSNGFDALDDDESVSPPLAADDFFSSTYSSSSKKRKFAFTQAGPSSKRPSSESYRREGMQLNSTFKTNASSALLMTIARIIVIVQDEVVNQILFDLSSDKTELLNQTRLFVIECLLMHLPNVSPCNNKTLKTALHTLSSVVKVHFNDLPFCANFLHLFCKVLKSLKDNIDSDNFEEMFKLLDGFHKLIKNDSIPLLNVAFVEAISEVLKALLRGNADFDAPFPSDFKSVTISKPSHMLYSFVHFLCDGTVNTKLCSALVLRNFFNEFSHQPKLQGLIFNLLEEKLKINHKSLDPTFLVAIVMCCSDKNNGLLADLAYLVCLFFSKLNIPDSMAVLLTKQQLAESCNDFILAKHGQFTACKESKGVFVSKHMREILRKRIETDTAITFEDFPHYICRCDGSDNFVIKFQRELISLVAAKASSLKTLQDFVQNTLYHQRCGNVPKITTKLVLKHFPYVFNEILNSCVNSSSKKSLVLLEKILQNENFENVILENFSLIFVGILSDTSKTDFTKAKLELLFKSTNRDVTTKSTLTRRLNQIITTNYLSSLPNILLLLRSFILSSDSPIFLKHFVEFYTWIAETIFSDNQNHKQICAYVSYDMGITLSHAIMEIISQLNHYQETFHQVNILHCACTTTLSCLKIVLDSVFQNKHLTFCNFDWAFACIIVRSVFNLNKNALLLNSEISDSTLELIQNTSSHASTSYIGKFLNFLMTRTDGITESNCLEYTLECSRIIQYVWHHLLDDENANKDIMLQLLEVSTSTFSVCSDHLVSCVDRYETTKAYTALMARTPQSDDIKIKLATLLGEMIKYLQYDFFEVKRNDTNYTQKVLCHLIFSVFSSDSTLAECSYNTLTNVICLPIIQTSITTVASANGVILQAFKSFEVACCPIKHNSTDLALILQAESTTNACHECNKTWVCELVSKLSAACNDPTLKSLSNLCTLHLSLSKYILSWVVRDFVIVNSDDQIKKLLSHFINSFSKSFVKNSSDAQQCPPNKKSACMVISLVQFLREQESFKPKQQITAWGQNFWLNVDYLALAEMALHCEMYHHALKFAEIWINKFELEMENSVQNKSLNRRQSTSAKTSRALTFSEDFVLNDETNSQKLREDFVTERFITSRHPLEIIKFLDQDTNTRVKNVMITASSKLKQLDHLRGITFGENLDPVSRAFGLSKEERYIESLQLNDIIASIGAKVDNGSADVLESLYSCGFDHIASCYIQHIDQDNDKLKPAKELLWKSLWRLSKWDLEVGIDDTHFNAKYHSCLKMINERDFVLTDDYLNSCKLSVVTDLLESCNRNNFTIPDTTSNLTKMVFLNEAEDGSKAMQDRQKSLKILIPKWEFSRSLYMKLLPDVMDIFYSRTCFFKMFLANLDNCTNKNIVSKSFFDHLLRFSCEALTRGHLQLALQQLCALKQFSSNLAAEQIVLECKLLWKSNDQMKALSLSQSLINQLSSKVVDNNNEYLKQNLLLANVLLTRGRWLKQSQSENSETIMEECLKRSVGIVEDLTNDRHMCVQSGIDWKQVEDVSASAHYTLASFADKEYCNFVEYMKSPEFEQKKTLVKNARQEIQQAQMNGGGESRKYLVFLQRNYRIDQGDLQSILERKERFLLSALEHYVRCLSSSNDRDILIYRVCSLWFENSSNQSVPGFLECAWSTIPTHKYVALAYQIAARLGKVTNENKKFQNTLRKILIKVCSGHPHHVLPVILALSNAHKDYDYAKKTSKKKKELEMDERVTAANEVLKSVAKKSQVLVANYQSIFTAYIQMAYLDTSAWAQKPPMTEIDIPKSMVLHQLTKMSSAACKSLGNIVIPTVCTQIDVSENYSDNLITFSHFKPHFKLCGGINVPKVLVAISSDGKEQKHLVKGRDDLRQDAVMQQVFNVVNSLLKKGESCQKSLKIRTYKVVPLSQRSGLVEWCEGTLPIGTYLLGASKQRLGAHQIYRPNDKLPSECRRAMSNASKDQFSKKYKIFSELCLQFKPVMMYFFFEKFKDPNTWFERRRLYINSVATSSIVGYILGLGDRHVQNILIDCETAELVHIDFGVAFEQGKCLPTPETVPFRLSRDIVDGFGVTGVEGLFRKTCENTMQVLRNDSDTILTIIEVLLHDPLHDWVLTPVKAMNIQRNPPSVTDTMQSTCNANMLNVSTVDQLLFETDAKSNAAISDRSSLAGRALLRVREKLQGVENNSVLSIEGQVNLLIQQATDPKKLCMLFAGWQPYV